MKLKDKSHAPGCQPPKLWRDPSTGWSMQWCNMTWQTFYSRIVRQYENNGKTAPTEDAVEAKICAQLPKEFCTGNLGYHGPQTPSISRQVPGGCKSCGKRK